MSKKTVWAALAVAMLLTACGSGSSNDMMSAEETATAAAMMQPPMMESPTAAMDEAMMETATPGMDDSMRETATPGAGDGMMEAPAWFDAALTDVQSGKTLKINGYAGKVVMVEMMAVWCTNCYQQQLQIDAFEQQLGMRDDFAILSLDIDPNENAADLKAYASSKAFGWSFAVAPAETVGEISRLYGDQFLNPPSTPILIVDRHGAAHALPFGIKGASELMKMVQPYLEGGM